MQLAAGAQPFERCRPVRAITQTDRVVIPIGESEAQEDSPRGLESQRVDELFAEQPHSRRAQDDDSLLVQADDPLVGPKLEELSEMVALDYALGRRLWGFHRCQRPF